MRGQHECHSRVILGEKHEDGQAFATTLELLARKVRAFHVQSYPLCLGSLLNVCYIERFTKYGPEHRFVGDKS